MHAKPPYAILAGMSVLGAMGSAAPPELERPGRAAGVTITFLANEGVMLSSGSQTVLIDALFLKYGPGYAVPADSTQASLQHARAQGDLLVVGVNGDASTAPQRAEMLAALRFVDYVTLLPERGAASVIRGLRPNIVV